MITLSGGYELKQADGELQLWHKERGLIARALNTLGGLYHLTRGLTGDEMDASDNAYWLAILEPKTKETPNA